MPVVIPAGTLKIDPYYGRVWIKCVDHEEFGSRWVLRSHFIWWKWRRQRVPKGWVLHHKDHERTHDVMSNLQLMTRAEHARLHSKDREWTAESRKKLSASSIARCTTEWRAAVSARVTKQHAAGKFGRHTWSAEASRSAGRKVSAALKGRPSARKGKKATPEQRLHYKSSAQLTAQKRRDGRLPPLPTGPAHHSYGKPSTMLGRKWSAESRAKGRRAATERERVKREVRIDEYFSNPKRETQKLEKFLPKKGSTKNK